MNNLKNIIESIVFASGDAISIRFISEKLGCTLKEVNKAIEELRTQYSNECGIQLLVFNGKIQMATNPQYREEISSVLIPIKEKELTKTILECAALIAYKQPITKSELEEIRCVSCDYAIKTLLELGMIEPCGRKDTIGKPILYCTTDTFLKRFKLESIDDLPDYNELMAQIAELNSRALAGDDSYLYSRDEYVEDQEESDVSQVQNSEQHKPPRIDEDGMEIPEFLNDEEIIIKIK